MFKRIWQKGIKQKIMLILLFVIFAFLLFIFRDDLQPFLLFIRKHIFLILLSFIVLFFGIRGLRKASHAGKKIGYFVFLLLFFGALYYVVFNTSMYEFMQKYNIYNNLDLTEIKKLPTSRNERIQPFNNIKTMAYESIGETEEISEPQLVRIDSTNRWTMAIQPAKEYVWQRVSDDIEELFSVPSTTAFPRFAGDNRVKVNFSIGESLSFSRNTYNAVVKKFNLFQLFNLEPGEVFYMKDDNGNWVEVVSLTKWKGFFFPYPTFGGVMIIKNGKHTAKDYAERVLFGKGKYVSPQEIKNYPFLQKQNILSENISRLQAESLMFLGGFTDPLPWNMHTSVKIPDLSDDQNQQPFITDFNFKDVDKKAYTGLYHWFGLEPIGEKRTSLSYSVFIPSDGSNHMMYYNHVSHKDGFAGVSAMPLKVMESKKNYDWNLNKPVEFRPYIKDIAGKRRMFVLSTIAAKRKNSRKFDGSATPDLALVDMNYRDVIWVDVKQPEQWNNTILEQLGEVWKNSEPDNDYFKLHPNTTLLKDALVKDSVSVDSLNVKKLNLNNVSKQNDLKKQIQLLEAKRDSLKILKLQREIDSLKKLK